MKRIVWTEAARADVRRLDKRTAMRVLSALHRFAESGEGNVKALQGRDELRLRISDYRLFFVANPEAHRSPPRPSPSRSLPLICHVPTSRKARDVGHPPAAFYVSRVNALSSDRRGRVEK